MASERLGKLLEKKEAINARIRREQAKARTADRKSDTRRKILAGAVVMDWAETDAAFKAALNARLADRLKRADDRALFGLAPLPSEQPAGGASSGNETDNRAAA